MARPGGHRLVNPAPFPQGNFPSVYTRAFKNTAIGLFQGDKFHEQMHSWFWRDIDTRRLLNRR